MDDTYAKMNSRFNILDDLLYIDSVIFLILGIILFIADKN